MRIGNIGDVNNTSVVGDVPIAKGTAGQWDWASLGGGVNPPGAVIQYAGASAPTGYLLCNGATVSQTTYAALYAVIGHTFGADPGGGNFILPNLKGRVAIGAGQGSTYADGVNATGTNFALAAASGREKHLLVTSEMPAHTHTAQVASIATVGSGHGSNTTAGNTGSTGGGNAHNTLQPYLVLNYLIKT